MTKYFISTRFCAVFITLSILCAGSVKIEEDDHSLLLTDLNWDHAHQLYEYILVFFYKPDCNECVLTDDIFVFAAKHAKETKHIVKFAFVNIDEERAIAVMEGVEFVPTIRFYRNNTGVNYLQMMSKEKLLAWLTERTNYNLQSLQTYNDGLAILAHNPLVVFGCILTNSIRDVKDFEIVASLHDDVEFRLVTDAEICQRFGLPTNENSISIYQYDFDIKHFMFGGLTRKGVNDFITQHHVPIYSEFSQFIFTKSFIGHYHFFVPVIFKSLPVSLNQIKAEIRSIAGELDGKIIFIHFDTTKKDNRNFLEHLSVPDTDGFVVVESNKHLVIFKPGNPLNLNGSYMLSFIKEVMAGTVEPQLMTSEPEEDWHKQVIIPLTRKTFDQVVLNKDKHVFVIIYAPDCRFSLEALNLFDQLGEIYKNDSDIILAKLDSSVNELPRIRVRGTPLFYLYLKDSNEEINFVGKRTIENIDKFLKSNGKEGNEPQYLEVDHLLHARLTENGLVHEEL